MIYSAVFFGVFGLGCLYNGATDNAIGFGVLALFSLFMALLNSYNYRREKAFSQWLFANAERLWNKSPVDSFKGDEYEKFDTLTQFSYCVSFLFFSRTYYSHSYHTKNKAQMFLMGRFYILVSLIYGWWAIPLGPINTIKNIISCFRGGHKYVLAEVLNDMPKMKRFENIEDFLEYQKQRNSQNEN